MDARFPSRSLPRGLANLGIAALEVVNLHPTLLVSAIWHWWDH